MSEYKGIDLRGRKMLHPPWMRAGNEVGIFPCISSSIINITTFFKNAGGSVAELTILLNEHFPVDYEKLEIGGLLDPKNFYSLEFRFYLVHFTKLLLDDSGFRYIIDEQTQLGIEYWIYEKGRLDYPPWIISDGRLRADYISISNLRTLFLYIEEKYVFKYRESDDFLLGKRISTEVIDFINRCVPVKFQFDRAFINKEEVLISYELMLHAAGILMALTNEPDLVGPAHYYGFLTHNKLAKAIFFQTIEPLEGFREWLRRTNDAYRMEFTSSRGKLLIKLNFKPMILSGMFDLYLDNCLSEVEKAIPAAHKAFLELTGAKKVKTGVIECENKYVRIVKLRWQVPFSSFSKKAVALILGILFTAILFVGRKLIPSVPVGISFAAAAAALSVGFWYVQNLHSKLKKVTNKFSDSKELISHQLDSLKSTTNELLAERDVLDQKVNERTAELNNALEQLKDLDKSKTNFIANVSHELRTPLTLISVPLEGIRNGRYGGSLEADHEVFDLLKRNTVRLNNQISQLLDFSRLDLGKMDYKPEIFDLNGYCGLLTAELESLAERKGLSLQAENRTGMDIIPFKADKNLFETLMLNLLNNALKFTETGGIKLIIDLPEESKIVLTVQDSGIGFRPEEKDALFKRFTQAEEHKDRHHEGSGIGLALVAEISELHGWKIDAQSSPGEGAAFFLTIPLPADNVVLPAEAETDPVLRSIRQERAESGLYFQTISNNGKDGSEKDTILLIEDNPDMGAVLSGLLGEDYNLHWCTGGAEALNWLETSTQPALIICDVMMPGMNGFRLREELLKKSEYSIIPFIFLTALADPQDRQTGLSSGAVDYIQKPFTSDELLLKIRNLVASHKASYLQAVNDSKAAERLQNRIHGSAALKPEMKFKSFGITKAEQKIVELVKLGMQDKEIAVELSISPRTVSSHLSHLYQKTDTQNRIELINLLYT